MDVDGCCAPKRYEIFSKRIACRDARRYRKKGLNETAKRIVDSLASPWGAQIRSAGGGLAGSR